MLYIFLLSSSTQQLHMVNIGEETDAGSLSNLPKVMQSIVGEPGGNQVIWFFSLSS